MKELKETKETKEAIGKLPPTAEQKLKTANKAKNKFKKERDDLIRENGEILLQLEAAKSSQGGSGALEAAVNHAIVLIQSYIVLAEARKSLTVQVDEVKLIGQLLTNSAKQGSSLMQIGCDS